jgi:hypothetical protein
MLYTLLANTLAHCNNRHDNVNRQSFLFCPSIEVSIPHATSLIPNGTSASIKKEDERNNNAFPSESEQILSSTNPRLWQGRARATAHLDHDVDPYDALAIH